MLSYPESLGTMDRHKHYVMFYINQSAKSKINFGSGAYDTSPNPPGSVRPEATTLSIKRAPTKRLSQAIALYMPAKLAVGHTANYGEQEMGALVAGAVSALGTLSSDADFGEMAKTLGKKALSGAGKEIKQGVMKAISEGRTQPIMGKVMEQEKIKEMLKKILREKTNPLYLQN